MKEKKEPNTSTSFKTNEDVDKSKEEALAIFENIYGPKTISNIAVKYNWKIRADYKETVKFWNKPGNIERIKHILDAEIFHDRGLRKILRKNNLQEKRSNDLPYSLVSFGLLKVEKYYAPNVRNRRVFIYSLLTVPEEEKLAYLMPFLSRKALAELKSEKGEEKVND
ncbi:MAG: hypothetical protein KAU62_00285 [Candidatus Heimdallarchaeota archaeon]|nr:hypothetical protein [Candidatus Heimdallarchaeota archaeon]MCK4609568.1 hypothetical protein [Candidatus Heimdallarchaeota archaeon]